MGMMAFHPASPAFWNIIQAPATTRIYQITVSTQNTGEAIMGIRNIMIPPCFFHCRSRPDKGRTG